MKYLSVWLLFTLACGVLNTFGQAAGRISWSFNVASVNSSEKDLQIKARLSPGWHLYSQFLKEGGPIPTRIEFERADSYRIVGQVTEQGQPVKFYDGLFDMDIIWYANEVVFTQRIRLKKRDTLIKGGISYMVCDSEQCIPCEEPFSIKVKR